MEAQEKNPHATTILEAIFEIAKTWMVIINEDGTPNKEATIEYYIKQMMAFAESLSIPDINPIVAAVCHYSKSANQEDMKKAIISLQDCIDLLTTIQKHEDLLGILEHAWGYWEDLERGQARKEAAELYRDKEETAK